MIYSKYFIKNSLQFTTYEIVYFSNFIIYCFLYLGVAVSRFKKNTSTLTVPFALALARLVAYAVLQNNIL